LAVSYTHTSTITEGGGRGRFGAMAAEIRNYSIVAREAAFDATFFHHHRRFVERAEETAHL